MERSNPILADYKSLLVFRNIGRELLHKLETTMCEPTYAPFFKNVLQTPANELTFTYLGFTFITRIELFFQNDRMPGQAYITTYIIQLQPYQQEQEIISYSFDLNYTVSDIFTEKDFAFHYLIDFHQQLKKHYSDEHKPFPIRIMER